MTNDNNNQSMPSASHNTHSIVHHAVPALQSTTATNNTKHHTDDENDNYSQASSVCEFNNKSSKWECVKSDYKSVVLQQVMVSAFCMRYVHKISIFVMIERVTYRFVHNLTC